MISSRCLAAVKFLSNILQKYKNILEFLVSVHEALPGELWLILWWRATYLNDEQ